MACKSLTHPHSQSGFTLIELLVVVVIIAVVAGIATLSIGAVAHQKFHSESNRLRLVLQQASDTALFNQGTLGWFWDEDNQYTVKMLNINGVWQSLEDTDFAPYQLPNHIQLEVFDQKGRPIRPQKNTTKTQQPVLLFLSSGEYQPFEMVLSDSDERSTQLFGNGIGAIEFRGDD